MRSTLATLVFASSVLAATAVGATSESAAGRARGDRGRDPGDRRIQIAILLDNSGSMSGLINQARSELWTLVNQFAEASVDGQRPTLEVALYSYGDPPGKMLVPLTTDLDGLSEALFSLGISGGSEYCGTVISRAVEQLEWSTRPDDLKMIFIAGNEPFTQGSIPYDRAIKQAQERAILVNPIHCGGQAAAEQGQWIAAANLADGTFMNINQNAAVAHIATPFDKKIAEFGVQLNKTYIPYGSRGAEGRERQKMQDANASKLSAQVATQRAMAKASANYLNIGWCLADAYQAGKVDLATIDAAKLPEEMRSMSVKERKAYVEEKLTSREAIKKGIKSLEVKRTAFVTKEREKRAKAHGAAAKTLDTAMLEGVQQRASALGFDL